MNEVLWGWSFAILLYLNFICWFAYGITKDTSTYRKNAPFPLWLWGVTFLFVFALWAIMVLPLLISMSPATAPVFGISLTLLFVKTVNELLWIENYNKEFHAKPK